MYARESLDPKSSLWDLIAVQLRRHREQHRQSGSALGLILDLDRSSVSRLESGQVKLLEKHAKACDRAWGTDELFECLVYFAKSGHNSEWYQTHLDLEGRSSELRVWELSWVPGLFQTPEYARAMFESAGLEDIDKEIEARIARQQILNDRKPRPLVWAFMDHGVLDQPVGGREVMRAQLSRLLELAQMPNITIRVVPRSVGAHVGRDGSFKIMTIRGADSAYVEACGGDVGGGGRLIVDSTDVHTYGVRFARIGDRALPVDASLRMINEIRESL